MAEEARLLLSMITETILTPRVQVRLVRGVSAQQHTRTVTSAGTTYHVGMSALPPLSPGDSLIVTFSEEFTLE